MCHYDLALETATEWGHWVMNIKILASTDGKE